MLQISLGKTLLYTLVLLLEVLVNMLQNNGHSKKPIHLALIPDGNRRFAKMQGDKPWKGHSFGERKFRDFLDWCLEYPEIKTISVYALSTENLQRPKEELDALWSIYKKALNDITTDKRVKEHQIKVKVFGDSGVWRPDVKDVVKEAVNSTKNYSRHILNIMLAYGSKLEINNAVKKVVGKPIQTIDKMLMVSKPIDLVIRTGGQRRLSNFMLYQASYAELYFTDTLWPDFSKKEFDKIIDWYWEQQKNFGK